LANRSDLITTNKEEETRLKACFLFFVCNYNVSMQQMTCHGNGRRKEAQIGEFMYRHTVKVEHEMYGYISNNGSNWNSHNRFKEMFVSHMRKTFSMFTTKYDYTWNITHYMASTGV